MDANGLRFWMLSQSPDWMQPWRARGAYLAGQGVVDPLGNIQIAQSSFTTGPTEPAWSPTGGALTQEKGTTNEWLNQSIGTTGSATTGWQPATNYAAGQFILDATGHLQRVNTAGVSGPAEPAWSTSSPDWANASQSLLADGSVQWACAGPSQTGLSFCNKSQRLQLRSMRTTADPAEDVVLATQLVELAPMAFDRFGTYARWDASAGFVAAGGAGDDTSAHASEIPIYLPNAANPPAIVTDLVMGYDGILYIAVGGALVLVDRRGRWANTTVSAPGVTFWRLAALPEGGVLALDRTAPQLVKIAGTPLADLPIDATAPGVLQPCQPNPNPPRVVAQTALPTGEQYVALSPLEPGSASIALLSWTTNGMARNAQLRLFNGLTPSSPVLPLGNVQRPYAIAGLGSSKVALLATNTTEALIYDLIGVDPAAATQKILAAGDTYVLGVTNPGPIAHAFDLPPRYANSAAPPATFPLIPLSLNSFAAAGATCIAAPAIIDGGAAETVWHRLYLEAIFPPRCGAIVWLAAADTRTGLYQSSCAWYPHLFANGALSSIPTDMLADAPSAAWQSESSEVAFAPTLLKADPIANVQGLFMVLIQRANKAVRNLSGRYLGVRIELNGDGRSTPEIAALRVHGSRFSYVQNYLPSIYREARFGDEAEVPGPSTHRDFFERFVNIFESQLTRIEDRVAHSYLLTRPESTPTSALPWLGGWIGVDPTNYPPARTRALLKATPRLYRERGTVRGITDALDVATNGLCKRGAIVVLEDFRLRHIFATILGADLSIQDDPLLPGVSASSNSIVGEALFLGDKLAQEELQALYQKDLGIAGDQAAAEALYDKLAMRLTIFVHNSVEKVDLALVRRIVEAEKPAHILASVVVATQPLLIGMSSLLGINTYLTPEPSLQLATIGQSEIGQTIVAHSPSLDPRFDNGVSWAEYDQPIARATSVPFIKPGQTIVLDASASTSPQSTSIVRYQWTLLSTPDSALPPGEN